MKKLAFLSFVCLFLTSFGLYAQNTQTPKLGKFKWSETTYEFGVIAQNKPVTAEFEFTNIGNTPLVITNARGSCGCTGVNYPKEPIAVGEKAKISATYNAAATGTFLKTVTVTANVAEDNGNVVLNIKGEVKPAVN